MFCFLFGCAAIYLLTRLAARLFLPSSPTQPWPTPTPRMWLIAKVVAGLWALNRLGLGSLLGCAVIYAVARFVARKRASSPESKWPALSSRTKLVTYATCALWILICGPKSESPPPYVDTYQPDAWAGGSADSYEYEAVAHDHGEIAYEAETDESVGEYEGGSYGVGSGSGYSSPSKPLFKQRAPSEIWREVNWSGERVRRAEARKEEQRRDDDRRQRMMDDYRRDEERRQRMNN